jgi:hypothetical protein
MFKTSFQIWLTLACMAIPTAIARPQTHDEKPIELSGFSLSQAYEIVDGHSISMNRNCVN